MASREIGRLLDGKVWSVDFGTGTTADDFAAWGNDPVLIDKLNSLVTTGIIAAATALSI